MSQNNKFDENNGTNKCKKDDCKCHNDPTMNCVHRNFRDHTPKLGILLSAIKQETLGSPIKPTVENHDEKKYKDYNYNGSFHKGLQHNLVDGRLVSSKDYETMKNAIIVDNQKILENIPLAQNSTLKITNPLASLCSLIIGATQGVLKIEDTPGLSSKTGASEMVELYAQAIARDVPFLEYPANLIINQLLGNQYLNNISVLRNLKYVPANPSNPFIPETIFRGDNYGDLRGPYISQLLLLNFTAGALKSPQLYLVPPTRINAINEGFRVEWGINLTETINIQNGNLALLPPPIPANKLVPRYVYSGRSLAEVVHNDTVYQFYYQAALILSNLGVQANPTWPLYQNQGSFVTNNGQSTLLCTLGDIAGTALKHGWYWKWQHFRKLRPEVFALWIHDIKAGIVTNKNNFDISGIVLENNVLKDIFDINNSILPGSNSYTLPQTYREGSPLHPAYISGHAILSGACATILKIFFNGDQLWTSVPGVISGILSGIPENLVLANIDGTQLIPYLGDTSKIDVGSEINKLAFNIAMGRNWAGIHYRSDASQGISLGEQVAIHYMEDILSTMVENNSSGTIPEITFRKFNGLLTTIKPTLCLNK